MEDIEISVPVNNCVICSVPSFQNVHEQFIAERTNGYPLHSDLKHAHTFINCLTIDPDYVKELTSSHFCLQCKTTLEDWELCQNQVMQLQSRSRQLKASLIAKLLESPGQPVSDTWCKLDGKLNLIRQSIKRRFDPRVVLETLQPSDFKNSSQKLKTDVLKFSQESQKPMSQDAVSPQEFMYRRSILSNSSVLQCSLCPFSCEDGDLGRAGAAIMSHMKTEHYLATNDDLQTHVELHNHRSHVEGESRNAPTAASCTNFVPVKLENDNRFITEIDSDPLKVQEKYKEKRFFNFTDTTTEPVNEYVHAGVQVTVVNGKHICGHCQKYFEGKDPRKCCIQHIQRCHRMKMPQFSGPVQEQCLITNNRTRGPENLIEPDVDFTSQLDQDRTINSKAASTKMKTKTPTFKSDLIKQVKPGEYLYRENITFYYKNEMFACGRCKCKVRGGALTMRHHLKYCEKRDICPSTTPTFRTDLIKQVKPGEYLYRDRISFYYKHKRFTCRQCNTVVSGCNNNRTFNMRRHLMLCAKRLNLPNMELHVRKPITEALKKAKPIPTFKSQLITKTKPGEYLYRDKIPFYYNNGRFTCGQCKRIITSQKYNMIRHLGHCEVRQNTELEEATPPVEILHGSGMDQSSSCSLAIKTVTPTFLSDVIKEVKPGEYLYHDKIPFYYKDKRFTCGWCRIVIQGRGRNFSMKRHLKFCVTRAILPINTTAQEQAQDGHQQQSNSFENNNGSLKLKEDAAIMETEDAGLIVPEMTGDPLDHMDQRVNCGWDGIGHMDPLQLMKIDFDCLQDEMDRMAAAELLGS